MHVALIAMSGVRAHNPELTALGLTLPGFVERGETIASLPSLSLLTLAALTPDPHEVTYHEVADIRDLESLPDCDLAAISTYSAQANEAYELADRYRAASVPVVMGGLHVTAVPDEALEHCDAVVVGEGEPVWGDVVADAAAGRLRPTYRSNGTFDLADAPVPRYDLLDPDRYNRLTIQTERGCPWRCEFCASSILLTERYKMKPASRVTAELDAIGRIWHRAFVELADDNSFVNKRRSKELVATIGEAGVRWFTETDISVAEDEELLVAMRDSGCAEVLIGLESPHAGGLDGLELNRNWKLRQLDHYRAAITTIQEHGIAVNACFVLGLDGDDAGVFDAVARFVEDVGPFDVQITVLTPFPGTPLYRRLVAENRLIEPGAWEKCTLFDVNYRPARMTVPELEHGLVELGRHIYSEDATARRRSAFKDQWRAGRARDRRDRSPAKSAA
jgi:radical SAM superfamily enzyme YgiQ (UPF0313 family)